MTTSALEDWLWRGDRQILKDMHWYIYAMWVYRVETTPQKAVREADTKRPRPRA